MAQSAVLPSRPTSAGRARRFIRDALTAAGAGSAVDVATLLVSELVTNAVLHAGGQLGVRVSCDDRRVRVEVDDRSPAAPRLRARSAVATTGRGLLLVDALATAWGVREKGTGKVVWFELTHPGTGGQ